jgi:hypothetical protein
MQQNMGEFENKNQYTSTNSQSFTKKETTTPRSGDYIDFEEVK